MSVDFVPGFRVNPDDPNSVVMTLPDNGRLQGSTPESLPDWFLAADVARDEERGVTTWTWSARAGAER